MDESKRWVPRIHLFYLQGVERGLDYAGGGDYRTIITVGELLRTVRSARRQLIELGKETFGSDLDGKLTGEWALEQYKRFLARDGIVMGCEHPLWAETGSQNLCLESP